MALLGDVALQDGWDERSDLSQSSMFASWDSELMFVDFFPMFGAAFLERDEWPGTGTFDLGKQPVAWTSQLQGNVWSYEAAATYKVIDTDEAGSWDRLRYRFTGIGAGYLHADQGSLSLDWARKDTRFRPVWTIDYRRIGGETPPAYTIPGGLRPDLWSSPVKNSQCGNDLHDALMPMSTNRYAHAFEPIQRLDDFREARAEERVLLTHLEHERQRIDASSTRDVWIFRIYESEHEILYRVRQDVLVGPLGSALPQAPTVEARIVIAPNGSQWAIFGNQSCVGVDGIVPKINHLVQRGEFQGIGQVLVNKAGVDEYPFGMGGFDLTPSDYEMIVRMVNVGIDGSIGVGPRISLSLVTGQLTLIH